MLWRYSYCPRIWILLQTHTSQNACSWCCYQEGVRACRVRECIEVRSDRGVLVLYSFYTHQDKCRPIFEQPLVTSKNSWTQQSSLGCFPAKSRLIGSDSKNSPWREANFIFCKWGATGRLAKQNPMLQHPASLQKLSETITSMFVTEITFIWTALHQLCPASKVLNESKIEVSP